VRELLPLLDHTSPAQQRTRLSGGVEHDCLQKAKAVAQGGARHSRCALRWFPTYGPRATPIARVCGEVHDNNGCKEGGTQSTDSSRSNRRILLVPSLPMDNLTKRTARMKKMESAFLPNP
jgi:hypothetical protein